MQFYCTRPNPRKAIQPTCRNGNYRTGGYPPRTLPFIPFDPNKPPLVLSTSSGIPQPGTTGFENLENACGPPQPDLTETVTGIRYDELRQRLRIERRQRGCCPPPESARYMRQPAGLGFVATPESAVRMQMIKMMREGHACDAGCTAKGHELQNLLNRAGDPCPVNLHISAAQLASAGSTPVIGDGEKCNEGGNTVVKYVCLNWEDILKKSGMKVKVPVCPKVRRSRSVMLS